MRRDVTRRIFRGRDMASVSYRARAELGEDVVVLRTSSVQVNGVSAIELVAAPNAEVERYKARMTPSSGLGTRDSVVGSSTESRAPSPESRPFVIALVGPTGAGKTTTAVKTALHPDAFGDRRVGFVTLDTYRAGAVAQLETYAQVAGVPLEVAYEPNDVGPALARLADRDVV